MAQELKAHVRVVVTKSNTFRARVTPTKKLTCEIEYPYEVTVGGESWRRGKGAEHSKIIRRKMGIILYRLANAYAATLNDKDRSQLVIDFGSGKITMGGLNVRR